MILHKKVHTVIESKDCIKIVLKIKKANQGWRIKFIYTFDMNDLNVSFFFFLGVNIPVGTQPVSHNVSNEFRTMLQFAIFGNIAFYFVPLNRTLLSSCSMGWCRRKLSLLFHTQKFALCVRPIDIEAPSAF